jgi:hypothetical protein
MFRFLARLPRSVSFTRRPAARLRFRRVLLEQLEHRALLAVGVGLNFTGSTLGIDSDRIPPDTMGAIGPSHFVELINGRYSVYSKTTGAEVQTSTLNNFWINAGLTSGVSLSFDPRVIYDHASSRWFACAVDNRQTAASNLQLAVSNSSDPTAGWKAFSIDADAGNTTWADFPTLGVDATGVFVAMNMFTNSGNFLQSASLLSVPKASLLAATPSLANATFFVGINPSNSGYVLQPVVDFGPSDGRGAVLAVDFDLFGVLNRTNVLNAGGPGASFSATTNIAVSPTSFPPDADQPGTAPHLETNDDRFSGNVFEVGNSLWAVHNITFGGRAALRWYEINEVTSAVMQSGTISDPSLDFSYPSIAANSFGDVVIGFTASGPGQFASSYAVAGTTSGGVTTFQPPQLLKAGVAEYTQINPSDLLQRNRWGDYSATTVDPADPRRFWTTQEWVSSLNIWSTQITEISFHIHTSVTLDGSGNLVITDTAPGGKNDRLSIRFDAPTSMYVISDPTTRLSTSIPGATGNGTTEVRVPASAVTGTKITFDTLNGDDHLVVTPGFSKPVHFNGSSGADTMEFTGYASAFVNAAQTLNAFNGFVLLNSVQNKFDQVELMRLLGTQDELLVQQAQTVTPPIGVDSATYVRDDFEGVPGLSQVNGWNSMRFVFSNPVKRLSVLMPGSGLIREGKLEDMDNGFAPTGEISGHALELRGSPLADVLRVNSVRHVNGTGYNKVRILGWSGVDTVVVPNPATILGTLHINGMIDPVALEIQGYPSSAAIVTGTSGYSGSLQIGAFTPITYEKVGEVRLLGTNDHVSVQMPSIVGTPPGGTDVAYYIRNDVENIAGRSQASGYNLTRTVFNNPIRNLTVKLPLAGNGNQLKLEDMDNAFAPSGSGFSGAMTILGSNLDDLITINSVRNANGTFYHGVSIGSGAGNDTFLVPNPPAVMGSLVLDGQGGVNILEAAGYGPSAVTVWGAFTSSGSVFINSDFLAAFVQINELKLTGGHDSLEINLPQVPGSPPPPGADLAYYVQDDPGGVAGRSQTKGFNVFTTTFTNPLKNLTVKLPSNGNGNQLKLQDMDNGFGPTGVGFAAPVVLVGSDLGDTITVNSVRRTNGTAYGGVLVQGGLGNDVVAAAVDAILGALTVDGMTGSDTLNVTDPTGDKFYKLLFGQTAGSHRLNRADTLANFNAGIFNREINFLNTEAATLDAGPGADRLDLVGEAGVQEAFTLGGGAFAQVSRSGGSQTFSATGAEDVRAFSSIPTGGNDSVALFGSTGNETLTASEGSGVMTGASSFSYSGFKDAQAFGGGGVDHVAFVPTADNDKLTNNPDGWTTLPSLTEKVAFYFGNTNPALFNDNASFRASAVVHQFDSILTDSTAPNPWDRAFLLDTTGNDQFVTQTLSATSRYSRLTDAAGLWIEARDFGHVEVHATFGNDTADYYDTANDWDFLEVPSSDSSAVSLNSQLGVFFNIVRGFDLVNVFATGYDGGKNDRHNTDWPFINIVQPAFWDVV